MCFWCLFVDVLAAWFASHVSLVSGLVSHLVFQLVWDAVWPCLPACLPDPLPPVKILCAISATVWGRFLVVFFIWQPDKELWNAKERSLSKVKPNGLQRPPTRGLKKGHGFFITWFLMGCFVSHQISKPPRGVWVQQWAAPYAMSYIMGILIEAAGLVWEFVHSSTAQSMCSLLQFVPGILRRSRSHGIELKCWSHGISHICTQTFQ